MNKSGLTVCSVVLLSTFLSACGGGGSTAASNAGDGGGDIGNGAGATTSPALASGVAAAHAKLTARPEALEFRAVNTAWVKCAALPQEVTLSYETPKNGNFVLFDDYKDGKELCYLAFRETPETVNIAVKNADGTDFPGSGVVLLDVSDTFNTSPETVNPEPPPAPVNHAPTANAGADQQANATASVSLSGSATDPDGDTLTYRWAQTGGSPTATLTGATTATPSFTTPAVNADTTLSFTLTVSDGHGGTATDTVDVLVKNVPNVPPTANAGADQPVDEKVVVNLAGSGTDTDGSIVSYAWTQTAGDAVTLTGANTATPSFTAPTVSNADANKALTFKLVVTDNEGATGEASVTITVNAVNENPTADAGVDTQANETASVSLSGSGTDPDGDTITYSWAQTDSSGVTATLTGAATATPSFTAPAVDADTTLSFTLTVSDGHGGTATDTVAVLVKDNPVVAPTPTGKLNDTGITQCGNASANDTCPQAGFPGQDAETGRDANQATNNDADGHRGFDFTKISSTGAALPADAAAWSCVKDNVTGLIWEVKTDDSGLHDKDWTYTWYDTNMATNSGDNGTANGGSCGGTSNCDTSSYVAAVSAAGWCGATAGWRMPSVTELQSIANLSRSYPAIDTAYFPNTVSSWYWSGTPYAGYASLAWYVDFGNGNDYYNRNYVSLVRLVRSGQ